MRVPHSVGNHDEQRGPSSSGREPMFNIPGVILALIGICAAVFIAQEYLFDGAQNLKFMINFAFIPVRFSLGDGFFDPAAWFTMFSYSFMHGSFAHIAINMIWLAAFGSPLAGRIGTGRMVIFWVATAVVAALTHYLVYPDSQSPLVGASGAISGMMGAAARYGFRRMPHGGSGKGRSEFAGPVLPIGVTLTYRPVITFVGIWLVINVLTGLYSGADSLGGDLAGIAWEAHIGGFVTGFFGIALLDRKRSYDGRFYR